MFGISREFVESIRNRYPKGTRIECLSMEDPWSPIASGTKGTVECVDDMAQIHMRWDNGRTLALVPGEDSFRVIKEETK